MNHGVSQRLAVSADWFLQEWAGLTGRKQAALVAELGWHKNAAFRIWHGRQQYRREHVEQVAAWLGIEPFELLMHPDEALALRRLRESAATIVAYDTARLQTVRRAPFPVGDPSAI